MPFESPYQAMMENELLFQQQPWTQRAPYQALHAVRPVQHALTGLGAGIGVGHLLGMPRLGALLGLAGGTAYGALSPQPTAAQDWAYHNPERVHVLRARAAYDYDQGPKLAALAAYGLAERPPAGGARGALAAYGLLPAP